MKYPYTSIKFLYNAGKDFCTTTAIIIVHVAPIPINVPTRSLLAPDTKNYFVSVLGTFE